MTDQLSEYGRLTAVLVKHARDAFVSDAHIGAQWRSLNYSAPPDLSLAIAEYDRFLEIVAGVCATIVQLPPENTRNLDSIYTRDASVISRDGVILCSMGKEARAGEPGVQKQELLRRGWPIVGSITPPGRLEGGDLVWLDGHTVLVGEGRRTNAEGIRQFTTLLRPSHTSVVIPLPDYPGQHDVMHLMSLVSPVDRDLAVVYSRLLPQSCRKQLLDRGYRLIEVPDEEFDTMGTNVLALGPRDCLMLNGNPKTRAALEHAGAKVQVYEGLEISLKGGGGPTCLTRPLSRTGTGGN
jgi:N-dimethylarginine dimethylaminohydrolase